MPVPNLGWASSKALLQKLRQSRETQRYSTIIWIQPAIIGHTFPLTMICIDITHVELVKQFDL
jgi:hypothetical protein